MSGDAGGTQGETEALTVTHWFDPVTERPYAATVRFLGTRLAIAGKAQSTDTFVRDELVEGIVPGSGPVSVTTQGYGLQAGRLDGHC